MKFSKDFLKLVFLALIIAIPISWLGMTAWLQRFAYKIDLGWWIFVAAGITALLISLLTISSQAVKQRLRILLRIYGRSRDVSIKTARVKSIKCLTGCVTFIKILMIL